jgi:Protein of unknown function (DUF2855)
MMQTHPLANAQHPETKQIMTTTVTSLEVKRDDLKSARLVEQPLDGAGRTVLKIDRFALTANNITYGAFGDSMSYWSFFPASDGFGLIPAWGYGTVVSTPTDSGLNIGERVYGYLPMASHVVLDAGKVTPKRFFDVATHRAELPPVYNVYQRTAADPIYTPTGEVSQMVLGPLLMTSFLIADFLDDHAMFAAQQVLISSASSKTSLGLAHCVHKLGRTPVTVSGLTSSGNMSFVTATNQYTHVASYEAIASLDPSIPTVFVDMAGSAEVIKTVHGHFRDNLKYSCRVGATHVDDIAGRITVPGAKPVFFFAPAQVQKRSADWGPGGLEQRFGARWSSLVKTFDGWMKLDERRGPDAVLRAYAETLAGKQKAETALVLSFN